MFDGCRDSGPAGCRLAAAQGDDPAWASTAGFGNADVAPCPSQPWTWRGWIRFSRPKTGIDRRCPLWPETVEALKAAIAERPTPKDEADAGLVFITKYGARGSDAGGEAVRGRFECCGVRQAAKTPTMPERAALQIEAEAEKCRACKWKPTGNDVGQVTPGRAWILRTSPHVPHSGRRHQGLPRHPTGHGPRGWVHR